MRKNCNNHGACVKDNDGNHKCLCDSHWSGKLCDKERCDPLCKNGGECRNQTCFCTKGFTGKTCNIRVCPKNCMSTVVALAMANVNVILDTRVKLVPFVTSSMVNVVKKQKNARAILLML